MGNRTSGRVRGNRSRGDMATARGARFLHDVASRTVASLLGAGILAIAAGGTFYWWRRELVWWFRREDRDLG